MSDIAQESAVDPAVTVSSGDDRVADLEAQLAEAKAQLARTQNTPSIPIEEQLAATQAELAYAREQLAAAQAQQTVPAQALEAHKAPSKAQQVLDAVQAGHPVEHDDLVAAKDEVQHYLNTAGPMKALLDAWETLRQL